jgi:hypothetical protein
MQQLVERVLAVGAGLACPPPRKRPNVLDFTLGFPL